MLHVMVGNFPIVLCVFLFTVLFTLFCTCFIALSQTARV